MITTTLKTISLSPSVDEKVVSFLTTYGGLTRENAESYAYEYPAQASELVEKMRKAILDDKSITNKYKNKIS